MTPFNKNLPHPDLALVHVEGGEFMMGDDNGEFNSEKPAYLVRLSSFFICQYQVTQDLYESVAGDNPSRFKGNKRPVEKVSWIDANQFIDQLNDSSEIRQYLNSLDASGMAFRLPKEAEWEYAARGGQYSQGYAYCGSDKLKQVGWYDENSGNETKAVGLLLPNELGIYDMSGNVYEWCEDWFDGKYYEKCKKGGVVINPKGPEEGDGRVIRGGSYFSSAECCRPTYRDRLTPVNRSYFIGFRLVLSLQSVG